MSPRREPDHCNRIRASGRAANWRDSRGCDPDYEAVVVDSDIERKFAAAMDKRVDDVRLCVKLPSWFFVQTPLGQYNPDWAIVLERDEKMYLVRETKGTRDIEKLAADERDKVKCGKAHFKALEVDFEVVTCADEVKSA